MALKIGNNAVANAFVGSSQVRRAYKGGTLVYQGFSPASEQEFIQQEAPGGPAKLSKIYGKTVVWNQEVPISTRTYSGKGITITNNGDGSFTANGTATGLVIFSIYFKSEWQSVADGHRVLIKGCPAGGSASTYKLQLQNFVSDEYGSGRIVTFRSSSAYIALYIYSGTTVNFTFRPILFDLTLLYGAGNEPTSVAQFEADYPTYNPAYDPGSLQSNKTTELRAYDGGTLRGSLTLNLSTLTGKLNGEGASVVVYPDGLRGVGTDRDAAYGSTGEVRLGKRAYQAGDESDTSVLTDGTNTIYPLATPLTYTLDTPLPTDLICEQGDILQRVSDNNCPFVGEMKFGL